jgi:acetyl-CoA carboxylase biotin carboxyl carrier protein
VTEGESKVRIVKSSALAQNQMVMMQPQAMPNLRAPPPPGRAAAAAAPAAAAEPTGHVVKSPMVGTFYRSSAPGAKPSWKWASRQGRRHPASSKR